VGFWSQTGQARGRITLGEGRVSRRVKAMTRRRLLLVGLAAVALLGSGLVVWLQLPRPGITRANYQRIRVGMTEAEVVALLGGPAGDYRTQPGRKPAIGMQVFDDDGKKVLEW
jgi:hypothetical protein